MAKFNLKIKALELRKKGTSIGSIAESLNVSKGTVSLWCSDIKLTESQKNNLFRKMIKAGSYGRYLGAETNRRKKIEAVKKAEMDGVQKIGNLTDRELSLVAVSLYWAEGSKKKGSFSIVNSDPFIINMIYFWLLNCEKVPKSEFIPRVAINEMHRPRISSVLKYWSNLLNLPISQFKSTFFIKNAQRKVYENYNTYYGTLVLRLKRSTNLKYQVLGQIEALKKNLPA